MATVIFDHLDRPSLDYWHAFDYCAGQAWHNSDSINLLCSSAFYYDNFYYRLDDKPLTVVDVAGWSKNTDIDATPIEQWTPTAGTWIWAEPTQGSLKAVLNRWQQAQNADSRLFIISSNFLARRLPEWKQKPYPSIAKTGVFEIEGTLRDYGLQPTTLIGMLNPVSVALGFAGLAARKLDQYGWSDRAKYASFKYYTGEGPIARISPVQVRVVEGKA